MSDSGGPLLYGLDLFSGIGGLTLALAPWVRPLAYCECDPYAQAVLLSRMADGLLPRAPIWDDVRTLQIAMLPTKPDLICGGFPCQDISVAGLGRGLEGERSGLFFEVARLVFDGRPRFVFLENVPAITTRGGIEVVESFAALGYDCRWGVLSAFDVGAPHKRERWWLLAHRDGDRRKGKPQSHGQKPPRERQLGHDPDGFHHPVSDAHSARLAVGQGKSRDDAKKQPPPFGANWWATEPNVGRVAHGIPARVDRIRALGNSVVPACAREAFKRLAGLAPS